MTGYVFTMEILGTDFHKGIPIQLRKEDSPDLAITEAMAAFKKLVELHFRKK